MIITSPNLLYTGIPANRYALLPADYCDGQSSVASHDKLNHHIFFQKNCRFFYIGDFHGIYICEVKNETN